MATTAPLRFFQGESDTFDADLLLAAAAAMWTNVIVSGGYIRLYTLTRFSCSDVKIQRRDPEKSSINLPSPFFFATTKPSPTTRRGEKKIASDGSLSICFYRLYKPCVF